MFFDKEKINEYENKIPCELYIISSQKFDDTKNIFLLIRKVLFNIQKTIGYGLILEVGILNNS